MKGYEEEGAPMGGRRELVNLTRRALEAERLLSERTRELAELRQLLASAQGHLASFLLKEGELLALADQLDGAPDPFQANGPAVADQIRDILRLPS